MQQCEYQIKFKHKCLRYGINKEYCKTCKAREHIKGEQTDNDKRDRK